MPQHDGRKLVQSDRRGDARRHYLFRGIAASTLAAVYGVTSELQLFDGHGHAFLVRPDMPESMEAYRLVASFFDRHLGTEGLVVDQKVR